MREGRRSCFANLLLAGAIFGVTFPGAAAGQESPPQDPQAPSPIIILQTATSPEDRRAAAELLGATPSPASVEVLRQSLSGDPDPSVCSAAARSLGRMGLMALPAINDLAQAGRTGCGPDTDSPISALASIAGTLRASVDSMSTEDLQGALVLFREAEGRLGTPFPSAILETLEGVEAATRIRDLSWIAGALAIAGAIVHDLFSAVRSVSGVLLSVVLLGLFILLLKNAGKFLPLLRRREEEKGSRRNWEAVELWLRRPGALIDRVEASPLRMVDLLRHRAREKGVEIGSEEKDLEEKWDTFCQTAAGGQVPAFAAARWVDSTLEPAGEDRGAKPPGTIMEAVLGEINDRYVPGPGAPPRPLVENVLKALAWETMMGGGFSGWIPVQGAGAFSPGPDLDVILEYARERMGLVEEDRAGGRIRLLADEELTARLGSLHLLQAKSTPSQTLAQLGTMHSAAQGKDRRAAAAFLKRVASALLDAAASLEGEAELGIAEEALLALANPSVGGNEGSAPARIRRLQSRLRSEDSPAVRERIIGAMGEMGAQAKPALPALMGAVEKESAGVALAAVETLGKIGPPAAKAVPLLLEALERGRPSFQAAATRALGRMGPAGEEGADTLLRWTSQGGVSHELHVRAAEALGGMPGRANSSIPALSELLRSQVATEVRAAAALSLARLDPGRREVEEVLKWARRSGDPTLKGMVDIALLVRTQRLGSRRGKGEPVVMTQWLLPLSVMAGVVALLQFGAVVASDFLNPRSVLPALFLGPGVAFLAGMVYAGITRRLPLHPALGGGATGWAGASGGLLLGFLVSTAMTPVTLVLGGGLALAAGAFGAALVKTGLDAF